MMSRRGFLGGTLSAATAGTCKAQPATATAQNSGPLVWPVVTKLESDIRLFAGHTDTVPDIVGRIGVPPSLVIFTEGNHLMVLLSDDIVGAWASPGKQPDGTDEHAEDNQHLVCHNFQLLSGRPAKMPVATRTHA
jgi:hypothetical protein